MAKEKKELVVRHSESIDLRVLEVPEGYRVVKKRWGEQ
jgi:hypothetical protein